MQIGRGGGAVNTNTRVGVSALAANTSGSQNTAYGYQALFTNNIGASNTAIGHRVLRAAGVGNNNIGIGKDALLVTLSGSKNLAIGNNAMETNQTGSGNVCLGHYAGYDVQGNNNVLIGPAYNETSADVTFRPPNISGDNQLVIGSGGQAWIRGDSSYNVSLSQDLTVDGDTLIKGDLTVNGTTTTVKSNIVQITDKAIELAAVVSTQFTCTAVSGSPNIVAIAPTLGLIPGMEITSNTAGITVPAGTIIVSIVNDTAVLSNNVRGSGTPTFSAIGPSDTAAEDGGIIVKGDTDKTFLWKGTDAGVSYNYWNSSEHINTAAGKNYYVNSILFASDTNKVIGPTNGGGQGQINISGGGTAYSLGSAVTSSSLESVGTLDGLTISKGTAGAVALSVTGNYSASNNVDIQTWQRSGGAVQSKMIYRDATTDMVFGTDTAHTLHIMTNGTPRVSISSVRGSGSGTTTGNVNITNQNLMIQKTSIGGNGVGGITIGKDVPGVDGCISINSINTGGDTDQLGIEFLTHPSTAGSAAPVQTLLLDHDGNLTPGADNTQDFGSTTKRWANVYSGDVHLNNTGMGGNEVDGSEGHWTMQEGADDLFLINRITGKKYKFNLTEVS